MDFWPACGCPKHTITLKPAALGDACTTVRGEVWRTVMADHGELEYATADGNDYASHEQTYVGFIKMVKVGIAVVVVILILMAYFLT
jgi:Bacterial aa3 type cytochrome c oxidase subunit IV